MAEPLGRCNRMVIGNARAGGPPVQVTGAQSGHSANRAAHVHYSQPDLRGALEMRPASMTATAALTLPNRASGIFSRSQLTPIVGPMAFRALEFL